MERARTKQAAALGCLVLGCLASQAPRPASAADRPPNVVLVYADDLGYGDVGAYGAARIRTPHVDRLAAEGVRFTDFYVAQAVCSASRAALLTGAYPNRVGILGALFPTSTNGIAEGETTLAEVLKGRGYATAIYGKWHLGHLPPFLPTRHGFDDYLGLPYSNDMWPSHPERMKFPPLPLYSRDAVLTVNPDQSQLTGEYGRRAVAFIEANRERPFFVYLAHTMPHVPIFASERFRGRSRQGLYGDVVEEIDDSVGQVLATLRRLGLERDTLVIFASDNGPWLSYGDHAGSAGPLREGKGTAFEGGVRVPFVARWPGRIPAGIRRPRARHDDRRPARRSPGSSARRSRSGRSTASTSRRFSSARRAPARPTRRSSSTTAPSCGPCAAAASSSSSPTARRPSTGRAAAGGSRGSTGRRTCRSPSTTSWPTSARRPTWRRPTPTWSPGSRPSPRTPARTSATR